MDEATRPNEDRAWQLAVKVIDLARGLIVSDNPFLSSSIGLLEVKPAQLNDAFACDGKTLYVDAKRMLATFAEQREAPVHDFTHVLLHGILLHPFVSSDVDATAWDLACDLMAESLVAEIAGQRPAERGTKIAAILKQLDKDYGTKLTTERLYRALRDGAFADVRQQWAPLVHVDDHGLWPSSQQEQADSQQGDSQGASGSGPDAQGMAASPQASEAQSPQMQQADSSDGRGESSPSPDTDRHGSHSQAEETDTNEGEAMEEASGTPDDSQGPKPLSDAQLQQAEDAWSRASKSMRVDLETLSRNRGAGLGKLVRELEVGAHESVDYREFLRQFAVEHEDMRLSDDEFDYVFYTYGLELYGNMPLIEPLEYRSEKRIRDFAVVIDTSSSVSAKVVQEFVDATFDVLSSEGGFFSQTNIHIIQADARVQSDAKITCMADLDRWRRNIKLYGFGGTDFRPAFRYVQELRQAGEFDDLQGLVYFTDGWGIYPDRMPPYKCAFVFYDEDHRPELVPPWALQVVLHPGEFESLSVY